MSDFRQKLGIIAVAGAMVFGVAGCESDSAMMMESDSASAAQAAAERSARSAAAAQAAAEAAQAAAERAERMFQQSMQK